MTEVVQERRKRHPFSTHNDYLNVNIKSDDHILHHIPMSFPSGLAQR